MHFPCLLPGLRLGISACLLAGKSLSQRTELRRQQFGNADQIVGDEIEHEVSSDTGSAAMFGLAHRAVLLAPAEDAFGHRPARLRHAVAFVPRGTPSRSAVARGSS